MKTKISIYILIVFFSSIVTNSLDSTTSAEDLVASIEEEFEITIQTDSDIYNQDEQIQISGEIINVNNSSVCFDELTLRLCQSEWSRFITIPVVNDSFIFYYNITYGDPIGEWNISAEITLESQNITTNYTHVIIKIPSDTVRYKVIWYSPLEDAIYKRGSKIDISVYVTENDVSVINASTKCFFPWMEEIQLTEIKQGYYTGSFLIPWDAPTGIMSLSVECINDSGSFFYAGGSNITIDIQPVQLDIDVLMPISDEFFEGDEIELSAKIKYPDNNTIEDGNILVKMIGKQIKLIHQENGIYSNSLKVSSEDLGSWFIEYIASDQYDNYAACSQIVHIVKEDPAEVSLALYAIITPFAIILAIIVLNYIRKSYSLLNIRDIENEIEELKRIQNEAATKYYKKGTINRNTYDMLRKETTDRISELNREINKNKIFFKNYVTQKRKKDR